MDQMQGGLFNQGRSVLNGFDLLAKSLPGMALLIGLITLVPPISSLRVQPSFDNFAIFLISIILSGLLIGEAVHKLTDSIEKSIFTPLDYIKSITFQLKYSFARKVPHFLILQSKLRRSKRIFRSFQMKIYWKFFVIFKNHRELFVDLFISNYDEYRGPLEHREKGELFDRFSNSVKYVYKVDITSDQDTLENIYPSMMSRIYVSRAKLSRRYQVLFSFCRSMWMVFFIITAGYLWVAMVGDPDIFVNPLGSNYIPLGRRLLPADHSIFLIPLSTGLISIMFMVSCGTYKRHYIEYITADFPWVVDWKHDEKDFTTQMRIQDY